MDAFPGLLQNGNAFAFAKESEMEVESSFDRLIPGKVELKDWKSPLPKTGSFIDLLDDIFKKPATEMSEIYNWPIELAKDFDKTGTTSHSSLQEINKLTHKTDFELKKVKIKLTAVENSTIDIGRTNDTPWSLLATNCSITIIDPSDSRGLSIHIPNTTSPIVLNADSFGPVTGRSLNLDSLSKTNQCCLIRSHDHVRVYFNSHHSSLFLLSTTGHCSFRIHSSFIEYWTDNEVSGPFHSVPYRFTIQNARFFYAMYCDTAKSILPSNASELVGKMNLTDAEVFHSSNGACGRRISSTGRYYENACRFNILMQLTIHFTGFTDENGCNMQFYYNYQQLPVQVLHDNTLVLYYQGRSLAFFRVDKNNQHIYFTLIAYNDACRGNLQSYRVY